ncbi:MAG: 50S ribosomal protein L23 [Verrucomicrobiota bacterium]|jgi:large subunit ribosomal protein L23|nr:50S ribosomal protein L23 [Verrucomicrobiota bacterium]|tara:strand:- start:8 stop:295 length:288 start_codon:yes stop_codon:yes gene_type:complete
MKDIHRVLKTIQVNSEKAQILTEDNIYVFKVDKRATKIEIKEAVKRVLGKEVLSVKTANYTGKKKRGRTSPVMGRRPNWKKAYVKLKAGEMIDIA